MTNTEDREDREDMEDMEDREDREDREDTEDTAMSDLMTAAESQDPAEGLRAVVVLRRMAEALEQQHVIAARRRGWTWEEVGDVLGVSRQAVHKKYRRMA